MGREVAAKIELIDGALDRERRALGWITAHGGPAPRLLVAAGWERMGATLPAVPAGYTGSPLTLSHGDPGPGNFLDDGAAGTIIDWEDAAVSPPGLDLGRTRFIALLGGGPEGYVAVEQEARARAVASGYLDGAGAHGATEDELAWWLVVAGVQFAHRRLEHGDEPGALPWRDAIDVLDAVVRGGLSDGAGASGSPPVHPAADRRRQE